MQFLLVKMNPRKLLYKGKYSFYLIFNIFILLPYYSKKKENIYSNNLIYKDLSPNSSNIPINLAPALNITVLNKHYPAATKE